MHIAKLQTVTLFRPIRSLQCCRSPTALKRPDRSKQCHCLQFCYVHIQFVYRTSHVASRFKADTKRLPQALKQSTKNRREVYQGHNKAALTLNS